jgi:hypothetical protein
MPDPLVDLQEEFDEDLPSGMDRVDEIHLPGDEEIEAAAAGEAGSAASATEPNRQQAAVGDGEEETPAKSRLDLLREKVMADSVGAQGEAAATPARDPRDLELEQARERERALLNQRIADMEAERERERQAKAATEPKPDPNARRAERLQATARVLAERFNMEEEEAAALAGTMGELVAAEREEWVTTEVAPIRERLEAESQERERGKFVQGVATEAKEGLKALYERGGTARELVEDFQRQGINSWLGRTLVLGWDQKKEPLPPNLLNRHTVEAYGATLASEIDRMLDDSGTAAPTNGANGTSVRASDQPSGIVPKGRRARTDNRSTEEEEAANRLYEETVGHMSGNILETLGFKQVAS